MAAKKCASCTKTVFPMEELKCLDKVWHKGCFKCQVCNMTLNMKNYKGYDKLPYCNAHYPETKFTAVADTPESKRLAQNSKIQSNVKYHAEYEKERGQYTSVADDPETLRVKKNMETISNVSYHGELARRQEMESTRPNEYEPSDAPPRSYHQPPPTSYTAPPAHKQPAMHSGPAQGYHPQQPMAPPPQQGYGRRPGSINDYDPASGQGHANSPYSAKTKSTTVYSSQNASQAYGGRQQANSTGSDYDQRSSQGQFKQPTQSTPYQQQQQSYSYSQQPPAPSAGHQQAYRPPYNPSAMAPPPQLPQQRVMPPPPQRAPQPQPPRDPYHGKGKVSSSMYDYSAADEDEVSFMEGDIIIHCEPIDDGWMTGTVERTGQHGMLPSNYVEHINW